MRVSGKSSSVGASQGPGSSKGASRLPAAGAVQATHGAAGSDALQVSDSAVLLAVAQEELSQVPDVRSEKVEALRVKLDADAYNPDGEAVADGLIREHTPVPLDL